MISSPQDERERPSLLALEESTPPEVDQWTLNPAQNAH